MYQTDSSYLIFIFDERHVAIKQSKGHNITTLNTIVTAVFFLLSLSSFPLSVSLT